MFDEEIIEKIIKSSLVYKLLETMEDSSSKNLLKALKQLNYEVGDAEK